jgi:hypothetical protein
MYCQHVHHQPLLGSSDLLGNVSHCGQNLGIEDAPHTKKSCGKREDQKGILNNNVLDINFSVADLLFLTIWKNNAEVPCTNMPTASIQLVYEIGVFVLDGQGYAMSCMLKLKSTFAGRDTASS